MKVINIMLFLLGLSLLHVNAQEITTSITGRVISNIDSLPIQGVTIVVQKGNYKTTTDQNGFFKIPIFYIPNILQISHIAYNARQIEIGKAHPYIVVVLVPNNQELDEVLVSTGIQKIPKERATGSFTQIDHKLFNEQVGTTVLSRLGVISNGVVPVSNRIPASAYSELSIRGLSSVTMSITRPLIILDNFEYKGDLANINPNDIESITFLKDAAASSIWGAKAANGVLVITTKKGRYNQRTIVELNSSVSIAEKPDLFYLPVISTTDFIDTEKFIYERGGYNFYFTRPHLGPTPPISNILERVRTGLLSQEEADKQIAALRNTDARNEFLKYLYRKSINQQYSLSLKGGSPNLAWIISAGVDKNISSLSAKYERYNIRFDNTYKPAKNLEITASVYYTQSKAITGRPAYGSITTSLGTIAPYTRFADDQGNPLPVYKAFNENYTDTIGSGHLFDWKYYPLTDYKNINNTISLQDISAVFGMSYRILKTLNFNALYRYENQKTENRNLHGINSFFSRNLINSYSQIDYSTGNAKYIIPKGDILDFSLANVKAQNIRGQFDFAQTFADHEINVLAGGEISETNLNSNSYRTYGFSNEILTYANTDFANTYPILTTGNYDFIPNSAGFAKQNTRFVSLYANLGYTYKSKYVLSGSARRDASNLFGVSTKNKWKPLWSAGFSWNISKESFYNIGLLPYLKFRITYGKQGNVDPSRVAVTTFIYVGTNPFTQTPYGQVQDFVNPNLTWEETSMWNLAMEFKTSNSRIAGSFEYYHKSMNDLYGAAIVDPTAGLTTYTITKNVGNMRGHGFDIKINTINLNGKLKWLSDVIINSYTDKVTKLTPLPQLSNGIVGGGLLGIDGYTVFGYFAYKWAGLDSLNGDPRGYLNNAISKDYTAILNQTKSEDLVYVGRLTPKVYGSIGNTIQWKNISVTARITYKFGYYFRRESIRYSALRTQLIGHSDFAKRWMKPGDEAITNVPSFTYPVSANRDAFYSLSEVLATQGDHIRFQYINLTYTLSKRQYKNIAIPQIQFCGVLNNIGIIWRSNKEKLDPDYNGIPPSKAFSAGCRINF